MRTPLDREGEAAGIISFYAPPHSATDICAFLASYEAGALVSPYEPEWYDSSMSAVRVSVHAFNTVAEAERVANGVRAFLAGRAAGAAAAGL